MGKVGDALKAGLTGGLVGMARTPGGMDVLGSISPLTGIISGRGVFGALTRNKDEEDKDKKVKTTEGGLPGMKKGGPVKKMAKGGKVGSASKRADGCATKGKTKGRFV